MDAHAAAAQRLALLLSDESQPSLFDEVDAPAHSDQPAPAGAVLVIDDDPLLRTVLVRILRSHGYEALGAANAAEARALLAEHEVGLVITDVVMPGESGVDVRLWLSEARPAVPVILISGAETDNSLELALRLPRTVFVAKPFAPDGLLSLVYETIGPATAA